MTALTTLNIRVVTPMPSVSVSAAVDVKPGEPTSLRTATSDPATWPAGQQSRCRRPRVELPHVWGGQPPGAGPVLFESGHRRPTRGRASRPNARRSPLPARVQGTVRTTPPTRGGVRFEEDRVVAASAMVDEGGRVREFVEAGRGEDRLEFRTVEAEVEDVGDVRVVEGAVLAIQVGERDAPARRRGSRNRANREEKSATWCSVMLLAMRSYSPEIAKPSANRQSCVVTESSPCSTTFRSRTLSMPGDVSAPVTLRTCGRRACVSRPVPHPKSSASITGVSPRWLAMASATALAKRTRAASSSQVAAT